MENHGCRGFSLIELAITISLMCILVAAAMAMYVGHITESKIVKAKADIKVILDAVIRYRHEYSFDPFYELSELKGRYLARVPTDPWGLDYQIDSLDGIISSAGPDGMFKTRDDITETYPNPRIKVALVRGTTDFSGLMHLKIEGRLVSPRASGPGAGLAPGEVLAAGRVGLAEAVQPVVEAERNVVCSHHRPRIRLGYLPGLLSLSAPGAFSLSEKRSGRGS